MLLTMAGLMLSHVSLHSHNSIMIQGILEYLLLFENSRTCLSYGKGENFFPAVGGSLGDRKKDERRSCGGGYTLEVLGSGCPISS